MLLIVLRKMLNNRWLFLCLLIGCILIVALVCTIPVYSDGMLQRMLVSELRSFQQETGVYPGAFYIDTNFDYNPDKEAVSKTFPDFEKYFFEDMSGQFRLPIKTQYSRLIFNRLGVTAEHSEPGAYRKQGVYMEAISGLEEHMKVIAGRMYSGKRAEDGAYEVVVTTEAMKRFQLLLDRTYIVSDAVASITLGDGSLFRIRVVGTVGPADLRDVYWNDILERSDRCFYMDYDLCSEDLVRKDGRYFTSSQVYTAFDYKSIGIGNTGRILSVYDRHKEWEDRQGFAAKMNMPVIGKLTEYKEKEKQLKIFQTVLMAPVLLMLSFYIFMVSRLIVASEENEAAVMKSRGAGRGQILGIYFVQSLILGLIALAAGPPLGLLFCSMLGAVSGFMEFVSRKALPTVFGLKVYGYALAALLIFIVTTIIPVFRHSRISIVEYKQKMSRGSTKPLWQKVFLDVIMLLTSAYGFYRYQEQKKMLELAGPDMEQVGMDPVIFLISTFFILGMGLLLLRFFPLIVEGVFKLGRHMWRPVLYASLTQVSRGGGQQQFIMLFVILALSTGIFSANSARTINRYVEDSTRYSIGADIVLKARWQQLDRTTEWSKNPVDRAREIMKAFLQRGEKSIEEIRYVEPPFSQFVSLEGIEGAARVLRDDNSSVRYMSRWVDISILNIIPPEYGRVLWFRKDFAPAHINDLLNALDEHPDAFLLSRSAQKKLGVKVGDKVTVSWGDRFILEGTVYSIFDYWPTFYPGDKSTDRDLLVMNWEYVQNLMPVQPYEVWIKKKPGVSDTSIAEDINRRALEVEDIHYLGQELSRVRKDPFIQGTNGTLTLSFIVSMLISMLGLLIFWILSIRGRIFQFGVFRAMGMPTAAVTGMIAVEQVLITGLSVVMGIVVGGMASDLFVPLMQMAYGLQEQAPPFLMTLSRGDYLKIYAFFAFIFICVMLVLERMASSIKIDQAVKLGED